jgi:hypothetical protein
MTVIIATIAIISTASHIPPVTDTLVRKPTTRPPRVSLPGAMSMSRTHRSYSTRDNLRRIAPSTRFRTGGPTLFVHAGGSSFRSRTRGLAQHDV